MKGSRLGLALLLLLAALSCATPEPPAGIESRDWFLVAIGSDTNVAAIQAERPTLRLEAARAAGFAGCNHFAGSYTLDGEAIHFGPSASTKMFCEKTQPIEDRYLAAFERVNRWSVNGDELVLSHDGDPVLRFKEMTPTRRTS